MEELRYHPIWFKMKIERRQMLKELPPDIAKDVLLACLDYLETGKVQEMELLSRVAFNAFLPDLEEAWMNYEKRVAAGNQGGRPPKS